MKLSKEMIIFLISFLLLIGGIIYSFYAKSQYSKISIETKKVTNEIDEVRKLKGLWQAKGIYSKLQALTSTFPNSGRRAVRLERRKLALSLENLSDKELNRILGKLASLPIRFKQLDILRSNDKFRLECLCNW